MKISVAMCTYNGSRFLDEQLSSISRQSRLPDELVICDDCSRDDTVKQLQDFAQRASFSVRIIVNQTNLGSTKNFDKAISLCEGDIIVLADQDDIWNEGRLQKTEMVFAAKPSAGLVFGNGVIIDANAAPTEETLWQCTDFTPVELLEFAQGKATQVLLQHNVVTGATMAFRSEFKGLVLPIPEIWVQDGWIALIISFLAELVPLNEPLVQYRQHANQQIGPANQDLLDRVRRAKMVTRSQFQLRAKQFECARERLLQHASTERHNKIAGCIEGLVAHMSARSSMPPGRLRRIPVILREFATRRYSMYSRGFMSAVRDLVIR